MDLPDDVGGIGDKVFGCTVTIGGCVGTVTIGGCVGTVTTGGCVRTVTIGGSVGGVVPPLHKPHDLLHLECMYVCHSILLQNPCNALLAQFPPRL